MSKAGGVGVGLGDGVGVLVGVSVGVGVGGEMMLVTEQDRIEKVN